METILPFKQNVHFKELSQAGAVWVELCFAPSWQTEGSETEEPVPALFRAFDRYGREVPVDPEARRQVLNQVQQDFMNGEAYDLQEVTKRHSQMGIFAYVISLDYLLQIGEFQQEQGVSTFTYSDQHDDFRQALALEANDVQTALEGWPHLSHATRIGLIAHPAFSPRQVEQHLNSCSPEEATFIACHPAASADLLDAIAQRFRGARVAVAKHPNTRTSTLHTFVTELHSYDQVHRFLFLKPLSGHANISGDSLRLLYESQPNFISAELARHPRLPEDIMETLVDSPVLRVRLSLATNPGCPVRLLEKLVHDQEDEVRQAANARLQAAVAPSQSRTFDA